MITAQSRAGIGGPRPHLRGLSATVTGLQQPADRKWAEVYAANRFGEAAAPPPAPTFKPYWLQRSTSSIGGGTQ
jgi:hypothetical protein